MDGLTSRYMDYSKKGIIAHASVKGVAKALALCQFARLTVSVSNPASLPSLVTLKLKYLFDISRSLK